MSRVIPGDWCWPDHAAAAMSPTPLAGGAVHKAKEVLRVLPMLFAGDGITNIRLLREIAKVLVVSSPLSVGILVYALTGWLRAPGSIRPGAVANSVVILGYHCVYFIVRALGSEPFALRRRTVWA